MFNPFKIISVPVAAICKWCVRRVESTNFWTRVLGITTFVAIVLTVLGMIIASLWALESVFIQLSDTFGVAAVTGGTSAGLLTVVILFFAWLLSPGAGKNDANK